MEFTKLFLSSIQLIADKILNSERIRYFNFVTVVLAKINVLKKGLKMRRLYHCVSNFVLFDYFFQVVCSLPKLQVLYGQGKWYFS